MLCAGHDKLRLCSQLRSQCLPHTDTPIHGCVVKFHEFLAQKYFTTYLKTFTTLLSKYVSMWAERIGEISRSSLSSICGLPAHRSVLVQTTSRSGLQQGRISREGGQGPRPPQSPPTDDLQLSLNRNFFICRMILNFQNAYSYSHRFYNIPHYIDPQSQQAAGPPPA